ncbi:MAG: DUF397 domain-containing protein [Patescibacteria group bacterium]
MVLFRRVKMKKFFKNGRPFTVNALGQKVDEDGFFTSFETQRAPRKNRCVSVQILDDEVKVRDTKDPNKTTLTFNHNEWRAFLKGVKGGEFDLKHQ